MVVLLASGPAAEDSLSGPLTLKINLLSLEEALRLAFRNNADVRSARVAREKQLRKAEESRRNLMPKLDLQFTTSYFDREDLLGTRPPPFTPAAENAQSGVTPAAEGAQSGVAFTFTPEVFSYSRLAKVLEADDLRVSESDWSLKNTWRSVKFNVTQAFHKVDLDRTLLGVNEMSRHLALQQLARSRILFAQGKLARLEVMRSELTLAQKESSVIRARNDLEKSQSDLTKILGVRLPQPVEVRGALVAEFEGSVDPLTRQALRSRPDLRKLLVTQAVNGKNIEIEVADASTTPSLSFFSTYTPSYLVSPSRVSGSQEAYTVGVQVAFPLPFWGRSATEAKVAQARMTESQDAITIANLRREIAAEVAQKTAGLSHLRSLIRSSELEVGLARETLRTTERSFEEGKSTALDVANALNSLEQAESGLARAKFDFVVGVADLDKSVGK